MTLQRKELEVLDRKQCLELLQSVRVGRLVFTEDALPAVQPVNFRLWQGDVVIRVAGGAKLAAASRNLVVGFQADELDPDLRRGWSVTVVGHAQRITDVDQLVGLSGVFLQPWVDGRRDHFIRIRTEKVTGRRLRARGLAEGGGEQDHGVGESGEPMSLRRNRDEMAVIERPSVITGVQPYPAG